MGARLLTRRVPKAPQLPTKAMATGKGEKGGRERTQRKREKGNVEGGMGGRVRSRAEWVF